MRRSVGITEVYWSGLSEDPKLYWKSFSRAVGLVLAYLLVKTGNAVFDWSLSIVTATFMFIVIETQRSYSKLSPKLRKRSQRVAIVLGSWAVAVLGIAFFAQAGVASMLATMRDVLAAHAANEARAITTIIAMVLALIASPILIIRLLRKLEFEQMIYHLPRAALKRLLIDKQPKAENFQAFAHIELSIAFISSIYASAVAAIVQPFMRLFEIGV